MTRTGNAQNTLRLKPQTQNNPSHNPPHNPSQPRETKMLRLSILNHTSCTVRGDILAEWQDADNAAAESSGTGSEVE